MGRSVSRIGVAHAAARDATSSRGRSSPYFCAGFLATPAGLVLVDDPEQVVAVRGSSVSDALELVLQRDPQCLANSRVGAA